MTIDVWMKDFSENTRINLPSTGPRPSCLQPQTLSPLPAEPLVSVLMANYNYAHYLEEAIESVRQQGYTRWELVVVDDGSTDDSVQILAGWSARDERIRVVEKPNGGHTSALNRAWLESRGELLCLLDADDRFLPGKLEQVVACAGRMPEAGFFIHRVVRMDAVGRREGVWPLGQLPEGWRGEELLEEAGILLNLPPTSGMSLRRQTAAELFPLPLERPLDMCPDQVLMRLAPLLTRIGAVADALSEYRQHESNVYSQRSVTVASIEREQMLTRALWEAQRRFLELREPAAADALAPLDGHSEVALLAYLRARLAGDSPAARAAYRQLVALAGRHRAVRQHGPGQSTAARGIRPKWYWFWRVSPALPGGLFRFAVHLLLTPGRLKQWVARVRGLA